MKIKNIIFNFGGVLIDWDPRYLYRKIFSDEEKMEYFLKESCSPEWNNKQDAGRSFVEATEELVSIFPEYETEIRTYYSNWTEMVGGAIEENVALIESLKKEYRIFGLTNWSVETFPIVFNKYSFFKDFEGIVVSGAEKTIKPHARIYQLLLSRYGLLANESLFIDDSKSNINAAKKLGFKTIHLEKNVKLKNEFQKIAI